MDSALDLPSQAPVEGDNWEVYRDVFVPSQDTRRPKAWERAPVPAHAPRLQGRKIWKRPGIQIRNNKENEAAMFELQSEGNGARKKRKVWAVKESIRDAPWKSEFSGTESLVHGQDNVEVSGEDIAAIGGREDSKGDALRFIPRKRTNTDHVITPKKPLRQTQLNAQARTLQVGSDQSLIDKPVRRRKSMRKSLRKSTSMKLPETTSFSPSHGPVSSFNTSTGTTLSDVAIHQTRVEVPQMISIHKVSTVESESIDADRESQEPYTFRGTNIQEKRRAISPKYSTRSTRNSRRISRMAEATIAQLNSTVEVVGSQSVSHVPSENLSDIGISVESMAQATNTISTIITAEEVQNEVQAGAVEEAVQPEELTAHSLDEPLMQLEQHVQLAAHQAKSLYNLPLAECTPTISRPSEHQGYKVELEQIQTTEPHAMEVTITDDPVTSLEETPEDQQAELEEPADESFCQSVDNANADSFTASNHVHATADVLPSQTEDQSVGLLGDLEQRIQADEEDSLTFVAIPVATEESPNGALLASELPQTMPVNAPTRGYEDDDTDLLRKFLTRVKANKAAKADNSTPRRKRSLPHSPLRIPLGDVDASTSPSPAKRGEEFDISSAPSPTKRRKGEEFMTDKGDAAEPKTIRRSGRTRLPVMKAPPAAPSLIPVRRLGQDGDTTINLRRNEEKEFAALTRINTRKNKGAAMTPAEVLILKAEEKTDPVLKQRFLKEMFEEKKKKEMKSETHKSVAWAKELTQFQTQKKRDKNKHKLGKGSSPAETLKDVVLGTQKSSITVGKPVNGTPGPKRRATDRT